MPDMPDLPDLRNWPDPAGGPLQGLTVVVTRAASQQAPLTEALQAAGATVAALATIAIAPPADGGAALHEAVNRLGDYAWVVLTSANGARALLDALARADDRSSDDRSSGGGVNSGGANNDRSSGGGVSNGGANGRGANPSGVNDSGDAVRWPVAVRVAAVGATTAAVLAEAQVPVHLVPDQFVGEALLDAFPAPPQDPAASRRVLLVRAAVARDVVPDGLATAGWQPDVVEAYRTVRAEMDEEALRAAAGGDVVLFASPSSVERFVELTRNHHRFPPLPAIVIGTVTAAAARAAGLEVVGVAARADVTGMVTAVIDWADQHRPGPNSDPA